jgi:cbb3-type cytochrome oxidase subunit 1
VTVSNTEEEQALMGGGTEEDRLAAAHFITGAIFLVFGGFAEVLKIFSLRFAGISGLNYGRLEPMASLVLLLGFAVVTLVGGIYYVLPRLTGTRLKDANLARLTLFAQTALVILGVILVATGFGTGRQPFSLPWWMHLPIVLTLAVPAVVVFRTITTRTEARSYVTLWFVIGGAVWLPLLYLVYFAGEVPGLGSLAVAYSDLFFSAGFVTMFVFTVGTGLFYYTVVREMDVPLASKQLALVGFWSLGFAAVWWGVAQLVFGPGPSWVDGVAAALGLAFPIGALANAANVSITLEGSWEDLDGKPGVSSGVIGLYLGVALALMASFASFPGVGAAASLTEYWEGIEYAAILGVGALLAAGTTFHAVPRIMGREIHTIGRARSFNRLTAIGAGGVLVTMAATGLVKGYSWIGGSNSAAYIDVGEGWGAGSAGLVDALLLLAFGFAIVAFLGQLAYASVVLGTVTRGKAAPQEVLVDMAAEDE